MHRFSDQNIEKMLTWFYLIYYVMYPSASRNISTGHRAKSGKNSSMFDEGSSQRTQLSPVKLIFYRRLKIQKHSVCIDLYSFGFFINTLIDDLLIQFFHVPNRTMCLSKKILCCFFFCFLSCLSVFEVYTRLLGSRFKHMRKT